MSLSNAECGRRYEDLDQWRLANPVILVNANVIGQHCGRFPTVEAATKHATQSGYRIVEVRGHQVWFDGDCYC